jgi:hypothetical protein
MARRQKKYHYIYKTTCSVKSKMVKKEEIDIHLKNGWLFGKKNKNKK